MERKDFIMLSAYTAAALMMPFSQGCSASATDKAISEPAFLSHILDVKNIRATGEAYLKQSPAENDKSKLMGLLMSDVALKGASTESIHSFFDKKSQQDFEKGDTTVVNGWILSVTEARQCALFALMQNG